MITEQDNSRLIKGLTIGVPVGLIYENKMKVGGNIERAFFGKVMGRTRNETEVFARLVGFELENAPTYCWLPGEYKVEGILAVPRKGIRRFSVITGENRGMHDSVNVFLDSDDLFLKQLYETYPRAGRIYFDLRDKLKELRKPRA